MKYSPYGYGVSIHTWEISVYNVVENVSMNEWLNIHSRRAFQIWIILIFSIYGKIKSFLCNFSVLVNSCHQAFKWWKVSLPCNNPQLSRTEDEEAPSSKYKFKMEKIPRGVCSLWWLDAVPHHKNRLWSHKATRVPGINDC